MKILLKQVTIADPNSTYNGLVKDILIIDGSIAHIRDEITEADKVMQFKNAAVSPGWVDVFTHFCDPGFEYRETVESGAAAAVSGGYTRVFTLPNTAPVIHSKSQVEYIVQKSAGTAIHIQPLGAVTKNIEGKDLAEMYDMYSSGAVAFSDGINPVQSAGLMVKALQYVKAFNGVVIQVPVDKSIGQFGLMHEGIISTQLGLPGIPAMAEELMIARDIKLARYADSKLHFTGVTTAKSLEYIKRAKDAGLQVTCSVTPYHLFFCDEDLTTYDTNLKVNPPLRSRADMMNLREAVKNGLVDCIASHHIPQDWDNKTCEFEYAKNGMVGLQTAYTAVQTAIPELSTGNIAGLFATNARNIFSLPPATINEGSIAELTIFSKEGKNIFNKEQIKSKSYNSAFVDRELNGEVLGIFNKNQLLLN
ncbi:dihydroorotase [Panacibacter ginsenosidivorans]|uniref:Dihydroorotase n=1 Tax=Panacibacter ginsenosidivorans TaxID=1813871 RepID=A0A5B8V7L2_9BACT|nr:dihydroorotase [Panacibacter ginsenosidivorans]QEC66686.1 dihydroorotase [Panacibacter ginsenosidivorans]